MKRVKAKWTVLALAVLLLTGPTSDAVQKKKSRRAAKEPAAEAAVVSSVLGAVAGATVGQSVYYTPATASPSPAEVNREIVKELVDILGSTESPTTFALTVMALEQLGEPAKPAVPAIIRNAERLKIFSGASAMVHPNAVPSKKQQLANAVAESIVHLLNGNRPQTAPACAPVAAYQQRPMVPVPVAPSVLPAPVPQPPLPNDY